MGQILKMNLRKKEIERGQAGGRKNEAVLMV